MKRGRRDCNVAREKKVQFGHGRGFKLLTTTTFVHVQGQISQARSVLQIHVKLSTNERLF